MRTPNFKAAVEALHYAVLSSEPSAVSERAVILRALLKTPSAMAAIGLMSATDAERGIRKYLVDLNTAPLKDELRLVRDMRDRLIDILDNAHLDTEIMTSGHQSSILNTLADAKAQKAKEAQV